MPDPPDRIPPDQQLPEVVRRKTRRRHRARREGDRGVWFGLGMFGIVGWSVAIPTVALAAFGAWLDERSDARASWTLTFLVAGIFLGCLNAWFWVRRESRAESTPEDPSPTP